MMRSEAAWLGEMLSDVEVDDLGSVLSVGSGTGEFRRRYQPWIDAHVFDPLAARGVPVLHHEMHAAPGVDVAGDLTDVAVRERLAQLGVRTVLCLNVFEHVPDRSTLAAALLASVPVGGRVVVTVPRRFPYHPDPIDTMFRPTPTELVEQLRPGQMLASGTVRCESLAAHWLAKPGKIAAVRKAVRSASRGSRDSSASSPARPVTRDDSSAEGALGLLRMALVSTEVTYAVVRRVT